MEEEPEFQFRCILLKILDGLSDNDCMKLKFLLGDNISRRLRDADHTSVANTLNVFETLFDQRKISNKDFTYLIKAFEAIECFGAAHRLKEHHEEAQRSRSRTLSSASTTNTTTLPPSNVLIVN
ncbi:unnamed protein product, partial [Didymodactylos carnosus]